MSLRPLSLLVLLAGLPLSLIACGDKEGEGQSDGTDGTDGADGTDDEDGTDGGDGNEDPATLELGARLKLDPASVFEVTGGNIELSLEARASGPDGSDRPLAETVAEMSFSASFSDGSELPDEAEVDAEGLLVLHIPVPGGLAPDRGERTSFNLIFGGVSASGSSENAIGLYVDPTDLMSDFAGDQTGHLDRSDATDVTLCHVAAVDADEDGLIEVLSLGVQANRAVLRACVSDGGGPAEWVCEDTVLEAGKDLLCGHTEHFRYETGPVGIGATLSTTSRQPMRAHMTWDGSNVGGAVLEDLPSGAVFGVVLGINNTKREPETPLAALLSISPTGGGRWDGSYSDGTTPGTWSALGTVTPTMLGEGHAWAGLFTDRDLSGGPNEAETPWTWSIDPSAIREGGKLNVAVHQWSAGASGFVQIKTIEVDAPDFSVQTATAAGEDLDGDGHPELVVEAWGEGRHAAWVLPAATDKASRLPVRQLSSPRDSFGAAVQMSSDGSVAVPQSSFALDDADGGLLVGAFLLPQGQEFSADAAPARILHIRQSWSVDEVMVEDRTEVSPVEGGILGSSTLARTTPPTSKHGVCVFGRCFASRGYTGRGRLFVGGGDGSSTAGAMAGELLSVGQDSGSDLVVYRAGVAMDNPLFQASNGAGTNVLASLTWGPDGPALALDGRTLMEVSGEGASPSSRATASSRCLAGSSSPSPRPTAGPPAT